MLQNWLYRLLRLGCFNDLDPEKTYILNIGKWADGATFIKMPTMCGALRVFWDDTARLIFKKNFRSVICAPMIIYIAMKLAETQAAYELLNSIDGLEYQYLSNMPPIRLVDASGVLVASFAFVLAGQLGDNHCQQALLGNVMSGDHVCVCCNAARPNWLDITTCLQATEKTLEVARQTVLTGAEAVTAWMRNPPAIFLGLPDLSLADQQLAKVENKLDVNLHERTGIIKYCVWIWVHRMSQKMDAAMNKAIETVLKKKTGMKQYMDGAFVTTFYLSYILSVRGFFQV